MFCPHVTEAWDFPGGLAVKNPPAIQESQEMKVQSLGQEDPLEEAMATHSSIFCLENPMDRGTWRAMVHRVAKGCAQLKRLSMHALTHGRVK